MDATLLSLFFHVPAVTAWVGLVMFDAFLCFTPGLATDQRLHLIARMRWLTVALILVILATGIWQTVDNPFLRVDSYSTLERLRENYDYGKALFIKHIFVIATFGLSLAVRFLFARRAGPPAEGLAVSTAGPTLLATHRPLAGAAVLNLGACLGVLLATARMTIELH